MDYSYATERYDTEVNAREYIERFHNADYFIKFCQNAISDIAFLTSLTTGAFSLRV